MKHMGVSYLISESEYLDSDYQPDCEYADGILIERNVGTTEQSWLETALAAYFFRRRRLWGIHAYRRTAGRVLTVPPLLWIEILSPEDQPECVAQTVREVLAFGVPYVWVIDPVTLESDLDTASG